MKEKERVSLLQRIIILVLLISTILFVVLYFYYSEKDNEFNKELKEIGYKEDKGTNFYENTETNNTLEDYNKDVKNNKNSEYINYYVTKDLQNFVEVWMTYKDGVSSTLNITSNLSNSKTEYNYELSYKDTYLIFEGNTDNNYECHYVVQENIDQKMMDKYCEFVKKQIDPFMAKRDEFTSQKAIKERIK